MIMCGPTSAAKECGKKTMPTPEPSRPSPSSPEALKPSDDARCAPDRASPALDPASQASDPAGQTTDFEQLIRDAKGGCRASMERLIRDCQPYLLAIANGELDRQVAQKIGASDIVQNSMLSAQRCIADFQGDNRTELLAWLRGILIKDLQQTHRHYHAEKRRVDRERPLKDDNSAPGGPMLVDQVESPSTAAVHREQEEQLIRAMADLSEDERQVIELRNWQRLSFPEIGEHIGRTSEATRKLWSRAIVRLQKKMKQPE